MKKILDPILMELSYREILILLFFAALLSGSAHILPLLISGNISEQSVENSMGFVVGEIADRNVIANTQVQYVDTEATRKAISDAADSVPPRFTIKLEETLDRLILFDQISEYLISDKDVSISDEASVKLARAGIEPETLRQELSLLTESEKSAVIQAAALKMKEMLGKGIYSAEDLEKINSFENPIDGMLQIVLIEEDTYNSEKQETISLSNVYTDASVMENLAVWVSSGNDDDIVTRSKAAAVIRPFLFANRQFDNLETQKKRKEAAEAVRPVIGTIEKGDYILVKDYLITPDDMAKLKVLQKNQLDQGIVEKSGSLLFSVFSSLLLIFILIRFIPHNYRFMQYTSIVLTFVLLYYFVLFLITRTLMRYNFPLFAFFIPVSFFTMLLTVITGKQTGFLVSAYLASHTLLMPMADYGSFIFIFFMGITGTLLMTAARKRIDIFKSLLYLIGSGIFFLLLIGLLDDYSLRDFAVNASIITANALISSIMFIMLLPALENLFNLPTDFRLLELTTMNTRILKRMAVVARGTYSHSVAVADLAESACQIIGANSLLARVGAYYHDIGKIDQPEYFIENQVGGNKHDDLKPSLSAAVIKSHVKVGIEKAKEIGLPQEVIDIIAEHHGNDIISYFYSEAVQKNDKNSKISPEDFSYSGSPPLTKEAAVVMLADSVDAASRTIKQPTTPKLEKLVWKIFIDKINNRQLINCSLSLFELEMIRKQFLLILSGRYHTRIEYPDINEAAK
jgi:cyclic-di-AMP phosphodiesterase PgpH